MKSECRNYKKCLCLSYCVNQECSAHQTQESVNIIKHPQQKSLFPTKKYLLFEMYLQEGYSYEKFTRPWKRRRQRCSVSLEESLALKTKQQLNENIKKQWNKSCAFQSWQFTLFRQNRFKSGTCCVEMLTFIKIKTLEF